MAKLNRNPIYDQDYVTLAYLKEYLGEEYNEEDFKYSRNFGMQPSPPYHVNDTWTDTNGRLYLCIKERLIGEFNSNDWQLIIDTEPYDKIVFEYADITIDMLIAQVYDHKIETFVQSKDPSEDWDTYTLKEYHVYDCWRNTVTDKEYVYIRQSGNPITYYWEEHECSAAIWNTTSGHKNLFNIMPTNYNTHDLWWIAEDTPEEIIPEGCKIGDWVVSSANNTEFNKDDWTIATFDINLDINVPRVYSRVEIDRKIIF